ncbi:MAG: hypothetical protein GX790_07280 [Syntrophomonadaceae bacterium]|nr:hypothetical protein [Syntrophomonadaceae bacterium]
MSKMIGNRKSNIIRLKNSYPLEEVVVKSWDLLDRNTLAISYVDSDKPSHILTLDEYLQLANYI